MHAGDALTYRQKKQRRRRVPGGGLSQPEKVQQRILVRPQLVQCPSRLDVALQVRPVRVPEGRREQVTWAQQSAPLCVSCPCGFGSPTVFLLPSGVWLYFMFTLYFGNNLSLIYCCVHFTDSVGTNRETSFFTVRFSRYFRDFMECN